MKFTLSNSFYHVFFKHQIFHVIARDDHALVTSQATRFTNLVEALNFIIDAANRLDFSFLIDLAGHGNPLADARLQDF